MNEKQKEAISKFLNCAKEMSSLIGVISAVYDVEIDKFDEAFSLLSDLVLSVRENT